MRAAIRTEYGAPADVVTVTERDIPEVSADGVLVKVAAGGLNSLDWRLTRAEPGLVRLSGGFRAPKETRVGEDFAGTVVSVGPDVTEFAVGDAVFGQATGAFAQYVVAHERHIAHAPTAIPLSDAAALPVAGTTALQAIRMGGELGEGSRVLVIGAAGGVGTYCVQLAVAAGAEVTGVCSTASVDYVTALGATRVIDYRTQKLDGEYDLIVELAVNGSLGEMRRMLAPGGTLVLASGDGGAALGPLPRIAGSAFARNVKMLSAVTRKADLIELARLVDDGSVAPIITARYPLEKAAEAMASVDRGRTRGKVLIEP